jgi:D-alanine-D-alanine ligase
VKEGDSPLAELESDDWKFGEEVLVEKYVAGKELTCAVMGDKALGVIEITSELPFYNYKAKYAPGGSRHILPAPIPEDIYKKVQGYALSAHRALGCRGVSRSDFRFDDTTGTLVCLEVNTQPGMTTTSLVPELATHAGYSFPQLAAWLIEDASLQR